MTETRPKNLPTITGAELRRRRRKRALIAIVVIVAVTAVSTMIYRSQSGPDRCGPGVTKQGDECVGVNDGSYVFAPELREIEAKIKAENESVAGQPHVTVAYLASLTETPSVSIERIRSQLEGAYVAQHTANSSDSYAKIRLVLANKGSLEQAWEPVVDQLIQMTDSPDHLVAVVGLGVSSTSTTDSARKLSRAGIPMVGAVITADSLNTTAEGLGGEIPGLTRVIPSVADLLEIVADYLKEKRPNLRTAMLVSDSNSGDLYTSTLKKNFTEKRLSEYWVNGGKVIQPYDGTPGTSGILAQFRTIVSNLCAEAPDLVFYAGRATLLPDFISQLRKRSCARERTITLVTGFDGSALRTTLPKPENLDAPVSVIYCAPDPQALADPQLNPDLAQFERFKKVFTEKNFFDAHDLDDGWAIMTHDAMLAATTAIEKVVGQRKELPKLLDVRQLLYLLNSETTSVPGAAGTFTIDSTTGDVVGRRLPVMELQPDGSFKVLGVYQQPAKR